MKIRAIKFLNLNSLKGEHEIRFDQAPFTESGIFAITGPTGAGKTTLLDAITVSLYGRVHRHTKDVFEIMTRHTAESYAEVEFEVADKSYRAKWSIRRSRGKADGQLQTQKMELSEIPGGKIIIEHPLNDVKEEIVKVCGLDYHQFLRSVILSQGDFTRFLKADENERSELLEKITDTGIYSQISIAAYDKAREERIALEQLKNRLDNVVLLSTEQREQYNNELLELAKQEDVLKVNEAALRAKLDWLNTLEKLELRKQELLLRLSEYELYYATHESRFDQLQKHINALVHRPALAELQTIEKQHIQLASDLEETALAYPELLKEERVLSDAILIAKDQTVKIEMAVAELEAVFDLVVKKDFLIDQAKAALEQQQHVLLTGTLELQSADQLHQSLTAHLLQLDTRFAELESWLNANRADNDLEKEIILFKQLLDQNIALESRALAFKKNISSYQQEQEQARESVKSAAAIIANQEQKLTENQKSIGQLTQSQLQLLNGKTLEQLEAEYRQFPVLINTSEQQLKLALQAAKLLEEQQVIAAQISNYKGQQQEAQQVQLSLQEENLKETELLAHMQQIHDLEVKVQNFDAERLELQPDQPCPLCGSIHHPFVEGMYTSHVSQSAERKNIQQQKVGAVKAALDKEILKISILANQLETASQSAATLKTSAEQVMAEFEANNTKLPKPLDVLKPGIIKAVIDRKKTQEQALLQQLQELKNMQVELTKLEQEVTQYKELLHTEISKSEQNTLRISLLDKQISLADAELKSVTDESLLVRANAEHILLRYGITDGYHDAEQTMLQLTERFNKFRRSEQELAQLQLQQLQKKTEQKNAAQQMSEKNTVLTKAQALLKEQAAIVEQLKKERVELFGEKDPQQLRILLTADQKKFKEQLDSLQLQLNQKQQSVRIIEDRQQQLNTSYLSTKELFSKHLEKLSAKLIADGLSGIQELNQLFLPDEEASAAAQLQKEASENVTTCKGLLTATEKDQETEAAKRLTTDDKNQLEPLLEEQRNTLSRLSEEKGKLNQIIAEDDQLKRRHLEVAQQIESQQKEFDRFQKLSALIGSADGKKFSRFAQGLTLARLTELANRHLERLSERYSIYKSPEKDLDLQIIDRYQADVVRPMSTLSGGESFLVSLALALGLSDLASRKVQINSLFIDEGFGTLDSDTLDTALTALENLQAGGKSIGIISHIEALKERIGTQIQLSREAGGTSKISVVSYGVKI